jgi:PBSX family phage terminase large subunit
MPPLTIAIKTDDHPAQEAFVADTNAETAYIGGVGSGKTAGGVFRAGRHVADWNEGHTGVIVSPTVPMLRNVIVPELRRWGLLDKSGIEYRKSANRIEYPNGSAIILESANNDRKIERLRGLNLAWAWMDEAAYLPEKVYQILNDRLRVGEYRNLFVTTTPRGFNWLYDEFGDLNGVSEPIADGQLIRTDTTTSIIGVSTRTNPANPEDYIEREERQHTGQSYQQEVEGKFVKFEGLVYPWFDDDNLVDEPPETYDEAIYGVDWGFKNPSVALALVREGDRWIVVDEWYETRCTQTDHRKAVESLIDIWGPGPIFCDPSEPANIEAFQREGLDARGAVNDVTPGIQHISGQRDTLRVGEYCQSLRNEFNQYQYKDDDTKDEPVKQNDHSMDALRYALFSHHEEYGASGGNIYSLEV